MKHTLTLLGLTLVVMTTSGDQTYTKLKQAMAVLDYEEKKAQDLVDLWEVSFQKMRKIYVLPSNKKINKRNLLTKPRKY